MKNYRQLRAFKKKFLEPLRNEDGEIMLKNGKPVVGLVNLIVRHNPGYFPPEIR